MTTESGGLSQQEFLLIQDQLLQLRNENYELREEIKKKNAFQMSPKNEALQFASKLINRAKNSEKDGEIDALRRKIESQEEEFRLQQSTLLEEVKSLSLQNETLKGQETENLEKEVKALKEEKQLLCQETIPTLNGKVSNLEELLENCQTLNTELEDRMLAMAAEAEALAKEKTCLEMEKCRALEKIDALEKENQQISEENHNRHGVVLSENKILTEQICAKNAENLEISKKYDELKAEKLKMEEHFDSENTHLKTQLDALRSEILQKSEDFSKNQEKVLEDRILLLETRYQLEVDDSKKTFEAEKSQFLRKIVNLEDQLKFCEEDKKASLKKHKAYVRELQKTLKEERKRADSYERKSEERAGWHVVPPENDGNSSHTFDGNESVSSLSAIESENVELITRLASLQKIHSENADTILQLESENSRLRREVTEKGELIENLIREKPLGAGYSATSSNQPKMEVTFRKFLNTLGQDANASDVREMNKKLQRMLEETLSKNILLQRDLATLMERADL
uniref:GRIP1-associated protein 1 n=1 Tax=Caenorhabditis japonica TaxID=281687 RepID=A0A8R1HI30_CAEJA